jgi:hypothetical protein
MADSSLAPKDDLFTLISAAALACILGDVLHEAMGHGVTAYLSGAHRMTLSTVALQSDNDTRLIAAMGTIVNLIVAAVFWLILRKGDRLKPITRYFCVTTMSGNLFSGTGYFFYSGATNFGDWARVIRGLEPHWAWRVGLIAFGALTYYASMFIVGAEFRPFLRQNRARLRRLCWTAYFTDGALATLAAVFNPIGFFYVIASGVSSSLGANTGLFVLPFVMDREQHNEHPVAGIDRSAAWIAVAAIASLLFVIVLGRGITWSR